MIGASIGLAAKRAGVAQVSGFDRDAEALAVARERGAIDAAATSLEEAVAQADVVVVAVPVRRTAALVREALGVAARRCTVTDVGSTKAEVCAALASEPHFVGGHPLAGSEERGSAHASGALFDEAPWYLCRVETTDPERYALVERFVTSLGASPVAIEPDVHDRLLALVSHLPHALATTLVNQAAAARIDGQDPLTAAGASFRDLTRTAGANPELWVDVFLSNAEEVVAALGEHRRLLEELEAALLSGDAVAVRSTIEAAARNRTRLGTRPA